MDELWGCSMVGLMVAGLVDCLVEISVVWMVVMMGFSTVDWLVE